MKCSVNRVQSGRTSRALWCANCSILAQLTKNETQIPSELPGPMLRRTGFAALAPCRMYRPTSALLGCLLRSDPSHPRHSSTSDSLSLSCRQRPSQSGFAKLSWQTVTYLNTTGHPRWISSPAQSAAPGFSRLTSHGRATPTSVSLLNPGPRLAAVRVQR